MDYDRVLENGEIDAVVIATPPETHAELACKACDYNKHVLVEKPMANSIADSTRLLTKAASRGCVLMVDHVYCYSEPVQKLRKIIDSGELGKMIYVTSTRINLGLFQRHCNVVWDLAVHDFSVLDYLFPSLTVTSLSATGTRILTSNYETAQIGLSYGNSSRAHIQVSWLSPIKVRQMMLVGSEKSVVWDDMNPAEPIRIYDSSAACIPSADEDAREKWQMEYRRGDVLAPHVERVEPLQNVLGDFVWSIRLRKKPMIDGCAGNRVVKLLARASQSLQAGGQPWHLDTNYSGPRTTR
jgi:predicted dehydrogenase